MEEIRVNEYVRTDMGICKIVKINKKDKLSLYVIDKCFPNYDLSFINLGMIKKHSPNIIDVIEYGDYVNGERVVEVIKNNDEDTYVLHVEALNTYKFVTKKEIKSIVTHESFNSIKYEVI